jgi:peptidoglycan hydrolase-like protein with peptidoglycan-binding domain
MLEKLKSSVGVGGVNDIQDVTAVQDLLNRVPVQFGGPKTKLKVDGKFNSITLQAIQDFQTHQFGNADGVIKPSHYTLQKLAKFAQALPPLNDGLHYLLPNSKPSRRK